MSSPTTVPGGTIRRALTWSGTMLFSFNRMLAILAGVAIVVISLVIFVNVILRQFGSAIFGVEEIVQMLMVPVIFFAIGYCGQIDGHIRVDILQKVLPGIVWKIIDPLTRLTVAVCFAILCWRAAISAGEAAEFAEATNLRGIPNAPVWAILSFGAALAAIVELCRMFKLYRQGHFDEDEE